MKWLYNVELYRRDGEKIDKSGNRTWTDRIIKGREDGFCKLHAVIRMKRRLKAGDEGGGWSLVSAKRAGKAISFASETRVPQAFLSLAAVWSLVGMFTGWHADFEAWLLVAVPNWVFFDSLLGAGWSYILVSCFFLLLLIISAGRVYAWFNLFVAFMFLAAATSLGQTDFSQILPHILALSWTQHFTGIVVLFFALAWAALHKVWTDQSMYTLFGWAFFWTFVVGVLVFLNISE